jgi:glycosyltransferase involved in cell wall biosynthesis
MTAYLPLVRQIQPEAKLCYDAHNAEYQLQQVIFEVDRRSIRRWPAALYSYVQARRIARAEAAVCASVDCVLAVSGEDAAALSEFRPDHTVAVIPNGIFAADYDSPSEEFDLGKQVMIFTGKMDYRPNVDAVRWFAADILPQIQTHVADARFYVVGQQPHRSLQTLRNLSNVVLTGWVPEIQPFLKAADVYVAPLRMGSGTRLKILEAMAAGSAVVATSRAAAGLPPEVCQALVLADDASSFAQEIVGLLNDPPRRDTLGRAARAAVETHYDWSVIVPRLLATYEGIGLG